VGEGEKSRTASSAPIMALMLAAHAVGQFRRAVDRTS